jgi:hypothetical protein
MAQPTTCSRCHRPILFPVTEHHGPCDMGVIRAAAVISPICWMPKGILWKVNLSSCIQGLPSKKTSFATRFMGSGLGQPLTIRSAMSEMNNLYCLMNPLILFRLTIG